MSCKVPGCQDQMIIIIHNNSLISPLLNFHGRILKSADNLPEEGKAAEICKRIGYIIAAPFAYLALAFSALIGTIFNSIWKEKHIKEKEAIEKEKIESIKEKEAIEKEKIESIPSEMLEALGGVEQALNLPRIANWDGQQDSIKHPIMFSLDQKNGPALIFTIRKAIPYYEMYPVTFYVQIGPEVIQWDNNTGTWRIKNPKNSEIGLGCPAAIKKGSLEEKFMTERIARLVKGEPVGTLRQYTNKKTSAPVSEPKPDNKDDFRPADSYLKEGALEQYMGINTVFYEKKVPMGMHTYVELNKNEGNLLEAN